MNELNAVKVRSYARLVVAGRWTIKDVPEAYRKAVQEYLNGQV